MAAVQLSGEILRSLFYQFLPAGEIDLSVGPSLAAVSYQTSIYTLRHALATIGNSTGCSVEIDVVSSMVASLH